jgi:hypothetical protein
VKCTNFAQVRPFEVTELISQQLKTFLFSLTSSSALKFIIFSVRIHISHFQPIPCLSFSFGLPLA